MKACQESGRRSWRRVPVGAERQGRREGYRQVWTVYPKVARFRDGRGQGDRNKATPQSCTTAPKRTQMTSSARPAGPVPVPHSPPQASSQPALPHPCAYPLPFPPAPAGTLSRSSVPQLTPPQPPPAQYSRRPGPGSALPRLCTSADPTPADLPGLRIPALLSPLSLYPLSHYLKSFRV